MRMVYFFCLLTVVSTACSTKGKNEISNVDRRANLFYAQGTRNLIDKEYTQALKNLLEANTLRPNDTKIHTNLGMAYYFKGTTELALRHLMRALEIDPKNSDARLNIATIYMETGKLDDAEQQYQIILKDLIYERQFRTYYNLGLLELKRKNIAKAITHLKASIKIEENYCPAYFQMGKIYYNQRNFSLALKMFKESSLGVCFQNPEPHYMQAMTLIEMKKYGEATMKLEEMVEKFALTKYEALARKQITRVNQLKKNSYQEEMEAKTYDRNILTPDF